MGKFLKQYEVLFKKARTDLKAGINLLEDFENGDEELDLETVMFHFQQCAEKLLKSLLSYNKLHFTKTHDLEKLLEYIHENDIKIIDNIEDLLPLSEYAIEGRYAIVHDDIEGAHQYIEILKRLKAFVNEAIKD
jgi:HEPN domain-containing protein